MGKIGLLIVSLCLSAWSQAELKVLYPNVNGTADTAFAYAALRLALQHSGQAFDLRITQHRVNNARTRVMLLHKQVSIADFGTSVEFEQNFSAIYFPVDLGLSGWRIFLIHRDRQRLFDQVYLLQQLQKLSAGQGIGWSDIDILRGAGIDVQKAPLLDNLFKMAQKKRFHFFPLAANEAHFLLQRYQRFSPDVVVEKNILLIYPFARLFFVHKDNQELRKAVKMGLLKAFENGQYLKLFKSHSSNRALFDKVNLPGRVQIFINNDNMTRAFKKIPERYFFALSMLGP